MLSLLCRVSVGFAARRLPSGPRVLSPGYEGAQGKNTTPGGPLTRGRYRVGVYPPGVCRPLRPPDEGRHHVSREPGELLLEFLGPHAFGPVNHHVLEAGVARFEVLDLIDDETRRPAQPRTLRDAIANARHTRGRARSAPGAALLVRVADEAEGREPLVALVVVRLHALDRFLDGVGEVEPHAPADVLTEREATSRLRSFGLVSAHDLVEDLLAVQRDHALDAARGDIGQRLARGNGLPDLHGQREGPRYDSDLLERVAAIFHGGRDRVVLAPVRPRLLVEALEEDLHLLLEQLLVGLVVEHGSAERLDLARVIAAPHAHDDAAPGHDVGLGVVLGQ